MDDLKNSVLTIPLIQKMIAPLCKAYDVKAAYLFGSYARGEATEKSDVDLRIDCDDSPKLYGIFQVAGFREKLVQALGKEVDLITHIPKGELSREFVRNLKNEECLLYQSTQCA